MSRINQINRFVVTDPTELYNQVHKAYEEFKQVYQDYEPEMQEVYEHIYQNVGEIYAQILRMNTGNAVLLRLTQECAQFLLELELSAYIQNQ